MNRNVHKDYAEALKEAKKKRADLGKAFELLSRAFRAGSPEAAYALATWYLHGTHVTKNVRAAMRLLRYASKRNVPEALFDLAVCYEKGVGTKQNSHAAAEYYLRAALHGDHQALSSVGRCYYHGIGVTKDRRIAWVWLDRAKEFAPSAKSAGRRAVRRHR